MYIVSKAGFSLIEKKFDAKCLGGYMKPYVILKFEKDSANKFRKLLSLNKIDYDLNLLIFKIKQEELIGLFTPKHLEEGRFWNYQDRIVSCSKMNHQELSNCIKFLEILLTLNRISAVYAERYLKNLGESINLEIEERFGGEVLDYKPKSDYDKKQYKEYLKIKK
jgi:hypothetical protein